MKKVVIDIIMGIAIVLVAIFVVSCGNGNHDKGSKEIKESIMVFAAASLTDVLAEIVDSFEVKYNVHVKTNTASSGTLARQIEQGGTPDVYISASKKWADYVDSLGYIRHNLKSTIAANELVLITPLNSKINIPTIDSSLNFLALLGSERLSMGDPAHVPAGKYARQSLNYYGWFAQLNKKTLFAKDVRSALMVVEMEEAPLGIVYRTDAQKSKKVNIVGTFAEESHKPIVYIASVCNEKLAANNFYNYLNSASTKAIWTKYGFKK